MQQGIVDCADHPGCTLIVYAYDDNRPCWISHAPSTMHVECRLGDAAPVAIDHRPQHHGRERKWEPMCDDCATAVGVGPEHRAAAIDAARKAGVW